MKKIVLGCAAVLLSLGLLAGCNKEEENTGPGPEVSGSGTVSYVLGVEVSGTMYYATGETLSGYNYEGELTTNLDEAVEIEYSLAGSDEYYVSFEKSGTTYYVVIENVVSSSDGSEHTNLQYTTTKTPLYLHTDSENEYFCNADGSYFLCFNSTYSCLYASSVTSDYGPGNSKASPVAGIYQQDGTLVLAGKGASASSSSGSGSGSGSGSTTGSSSIPEVDGDTYTLEVGTATIIDNFKTSDDQNFTIGSGGTPDATCQVSGETFNFKDVFTLSFASPVAENGTPSRIWSHGIRVYGGNSFTVSAFSEWKITSVVLAIYLNSDSLTITVTDGQEQQLATSSNADTITATPSDGAASIVTSLSGTSHNVEFSTITVTATKVAS